MCLTHIKLRVCVRENTLNRVISSGAIKVNIYTKMLVRTFSVTFNEAWKDFIEPRLKP